MDLISCFQKIKSCQRIKENKENYMRKIKNSQLNIFFHNYFKTESLARRKKARKLGGKINKLFFLTIFYIFLFSEKKIFFISRFFQCFCFYWSDTSKIRDVLIENRTGRKKYIVKRDENFVLGKFLFLKQIEWSTFLHFLLLKVHDCV